MNKTDSVSNLVIGLGEVGKALQSILECDGIDKGDKSTGQYDVLHIAFPYGDFFKSKVNAYAAFYNAKLIIVHSTVPIGTCDPEGWIHSPIRGVHPNLEQGIRTFVKYFGGDTSDAKAAASIFEIKGIPTYLTAKAADTEALKLWDTTQYGILILLNKEIYKFCQKNHLDFDTIYTHANETYNEGYMKLGRPEVIRPALKYSGFKIGGHCVLQNAKLLKSESAYKLRIYDQNH